MKTYRVTLFISMQQHMRTVSVFDGLRAVCKPVILLGLMFLFSGGAVVYAKPLPSLSVKLMADNEIIAGQLVWLRAVVASPAASDIKVYLTLPRGVGLISGENVTELSLDAHEDKTLYYHIQLPSVLTGQVIVKVEKGSTHGVYMSTSDVLNLSASSSIQSREKSQSGEFLGRRGETPLRIMPLHP